MIWLFAFAYGMLALIAVSNLFLMPRPGRRADGPKIVILIPARNEAHNLRELIPQLTPQAPVIVFDDESEDGTGAVAEQLGATVVRPAEKLPKGWTGKNRACHELGRAAAETDAEWFCFVDADVRVQPDFVDAVRWLCAKASSPKGRIGLIRPIRMADQPEAAMITGFPEIVPGRGVQPLFLAWVGWVLLSTNPFGLVARSGLGHNRFSNGQFHVWHRDLYLRLQPNEAVKSRILEDVMIGRLLAREHVPVYVANISEVFAVKMYDTWQETLDGMSKNSYEIMGSTWGSYGLALLLFVLAWGWLLAPWTYLALALSGVASAILVRARASGLLVAALAMPLIVSVGSYTILRSVMWKRRGTVVWKGRTY